MTDGKGRRWNGNLPPRMTWQERQERHQANVQRERERWKETFEGLDRELAELKQVEAERAHAEGFRTVEERRSLTVDRAAAHRYLRRVLLRKEYLELASRLEAREAELAQRRQKRATRRNTRETDSGDAGQSR